MSGTKDYFQGQATIESYGLPGPEFYNLDPDLRVWHSTSGCFVLGNETFTQTPNNTAVKFWTKLLGPQPNVYRGYYPSKQEADSALRADGTKIRFNRDHQTINFTYKGESIKMEDKIERRNFLSTENIDSASALVVKNDCIIFKPLSNRAGSETMLADKKTGKVFARYFTYQTYIDHNK